MINYKANIRGWIYQRYAEFKYKLGIDYLIELIMPIFIFFLVFTILLTILDV